MEALEIQVKHPGRADCGQPEHETEGADGERAKMNIWIHARVLYEYSQPSLAEGAAMGEDSVWPPPLIARSHRLACLF
jgi:hypothetical protein